MTKTSYILKQNRIEKLSRDDQLCLMFDLINAISLVKTRTDTALLLKDLLTTREIKNLCKRLRIAKLLLSGKTDREIAQEIHSGFATIAKVSLWLNQGGEGLRNVISKLPLKYQIPDKLPAIAFEFQLPRLISTLITYSIANNQETFLEDFAKGITDKELLDRALK
jgi:uncharacterized protein YerC